jgi:hypothetical protein
MTARQRYGAAGATGRSTEGAVEVDQAHDEPGWRKRTGIVPPVTDRPDADDKGAPRSDVRRGRPDRQDRPDRTRPTPEPEAGAVTPRALRPSGPSRKLGRSLPRVGDNTASVTEESPDRSTVDPFRFGDARLVPQREDVPGDVSDDGADDVSDDGADDGLVADAATVDGSDADAGFDDVPTDGSLGFGGAHLVSSHGDDPAPLAPVDEAGATTGPNDDIVPEPTTIDPIPRTGSASTAAALSALSALLARFDDDAGAADGDTPTPEPASDQPDDAVTPADADEPDTDASGTLTPEPDTDDTVTPADADQPHTDSSGTLTD